ncbi:hypothetical protein E9549_03710 [Blastococcus sp. MG754426]|uniref:hypothetical protein n=1 Tax=unclassified Blastococcus TaxID=2619396 RepID=UPI001EF0ABD5|nr:MULTISPECIES: hypothetical protein [unclassified Blastococcus]MCF6506518.1 hypothetical protein [Blastococcus sp. MG754426]MCF6511199.1 hypothetical protein [Blastococcus sp. MG754427]MCF6734442.1 hypothetical protein [Blastococcus sp. KM273129]
MDGRRILRALAVGIAAAVLGGAVGAVLTRGLMRLVALVAEGDPAFTWSGLAFIAIFYVVFLAPGAVALAWRRSRWSLAVLALGAVAIPVQAAGIAQSDLEGVGPLSAGRWIALTALFVAVAVVYAFQAVLVHRVACSGGRDRGHEPAARLTAA